MISAQTDRTDAEIPFIVGREDGHQAICERTEYGAAKGQIRWICNAKIRWKEQTGKLGTKEISLRRVQEVNVEIENPVAPRADKLQPTVETIEIEDEELRAEWCTNLQRILLKAKNPLQAGSLTVSFRRSLK